MTELVPQNPSEKPPITPESDQECLFLAGELDTQIIEWYTVATSHHPSLRFKRMADIIIHDCTIIDEDGHTPADIPRVGQNEEEKEAQHERAERLRHIAPYINNPELSTVQIAHPSYSEYFDRLREIPEQEGDEVDVFHTALEYLVRTFALREQLEQRGDGHTFNALLIGQVFNRLVTDSNKV